MKILILVDYFQPVLGYTPTFLAQEYMRQGHEVRVVTSDRYYPFPDYEHTAGKILGERYTRSGYQVEEGIPTYREKTICEGFSRSIFQGIARHIASFDPDIVIVNGMTTYGIIKAAHLKKKYKYRLITFDSHLPSVLGGSYLKKLFYWIFRKLFLNLLLKNVDKFIAVQKDTVYVVNKYYGIPLERIELIPLGTDTERFRYDAEQRGSMRKILGIPATHQVIIYTGKLTKEKGYDILMHATIPIVQSNNSVSVVIVGSGSPVLVDQMNALAGDALQNYHYVPYVKNDELYTYYSMADLGVWPLQESISMVEAASCKLPFVCNDHMGATARLQNNNAAQYNKGDYQDLERVIKELLADPEELQKMGERGKDLVDREFSWKIVAQRFLTGYSLDDK